LAVEVVGAAADSAVAVVGSAAAARPGVGEARTVKPRELISPEAQLRIEAAVADAERTTSGEIVVVVVAACDAYAHVGWRLGVLLAAALFLGIAIFAPGVPISWILAAQLAGLLAGLALGRLAAVRHHLVSDSVQEARVAERARRAFAEQGLARTAARTGILIFVALLEHRVVVLADEGIHRALGPEERWEDVVELVLAGVREGRADEGLTAAVRRCGEILAAHVPPASVNPNELRNTLILED
jgi:putative membrane protein